jgi:uncharacterized protein YdaU (DUF1376 family)
MSEQPYMKLWVGDFASDTLHLSYGEVGQYMLLLMAMWRGGGSLPNDPKFLKRITRGPVRPAVMAYFSVEGDKITQKRLAVELKKAKEKSESAAESARAKYRKDKASPPANGHANAERSDSYYSHSHIKEDIPPKKEVSKKECLGNFFSEFWEVYPRKVAKGDALKAYPKALSKASHAEIVAGAKRYRASKPDPEFTAYPATWLNGDRWLDEVPKPNGPVSHGPWKPLPSVVDPVKPPPEDRERQLQRLLKARAM